MATDDFFRARLSGCVPSASCVETDIAGLTTWLRLTFYHRT